MTTAVLDKISILQPTVATDLITEHKIYLASAAISLEVALSSGLKTVVCASDLPDDLRGHFDSDRKGGILLPHGHLDGSVSFTYRPDNPVRDDDGNVRKYLKQANRPASQALSVHPSMMDRVGKGYPVVLVEGDKGYLAATTNAPADTLVVGVPGCWGWSKDNVPVPDLQTLVHGAPMVYISFDGDVRAGSVRDAAERLTEALGMFGVERRNVRYVSLPAGTKLSIDDVLAGFDETLRRDMLKNLLSNAAKTLGRRPAAKKKDRTSAGVQLGECDWDAGVMKNDLIVHTNDDGSTRVTGGEIILQAAIRQIRIIMTTDDLLSRPQPAERLSVVEVAIGETGKPWRQECTVEVHPDLLLKPRDILALTDIPEAGLIHVPHAASREAEVLRRTIVESQSVDQHIESRVAHTGWTTLSDGRLGYLHEGGVITAGGNSDELSALVAGEGRSKLAFADPATVSDRAAAMGAIYRLKGTVSDAVFYATLGATYQPLTGRPPSGSCTIVGEHGSGKSSFVKNVLSVLPTPVWTTMRNHTEAYLRLFPVGMHQLPMLYDDLAITDDIKMNEQMLSAYRSLVRTAYDGAETARGHTVESATGGGKRETANLQRNEPFMIFTAEMRLDRDPSTMERTLAVRHAMRGPEKAEEARAIGEEVAASGLLHEGFVLTIQSIAATMDRNAKRVRDQDAASLMKLQHAENYKSARESTQMIATAAGMTSSRQMDVIASIATGVLLYMQAWSDIVPEVMTEDFNPFDEMDVAIRAMVAAATDEADDPGSRMLDLMRQAVASRKAVIEGGKEKAVVGDSNKVVMGRHYSLKESPGKPVRCIAFYPSTVAEVLGLGEKQAGQVALALRSKVIKSAQGRTARVIRVDDGQMGCFLVPVSIWDGVEDENAHRGSSS